MWESDKVKEGGLSSRGGKCGKVNTRRVLGAWRAIERKSSLVSSVRQIKLRSSLLINRHSPLPGKGRGDTPLQREMCARFREEQNRELSTVLKSKRPIWGGTCCSLNCFSQEAKDFSKDRHPGTKDAGEPCLNVFLVLSL